MEMAHRETATRTPAVGRIIPSVAGTTTTTLITPATTPTTITLTKPNNNKRKSTIDLN